MQVPVFLVLFMAPVWLPYDLLVGIVHAAASVNQATLLLECSRGFIAGTRLRSSRPSRCWPGWRAHRPVGARRLARSAERSALIEVGSPSWLRSTQSEGDGYAVANVDALADGSGWKVRRALGVTPSA